MSENTNSNISEDVKQDQPEVIVIGAGVVGCAIAYALGNEGRKVVVFEKDMRKPDRIVGELMQPGGVLQLQRLGLQGSFSLFILCYFSNIVCLLVDY